MNSWPDSADHAWQEAKAEIRQILIERAGTRGMIPYSELAPRVRAISLEAHDPRLFRLLDELSREENAAGRGMLSAIVVHKIGDMQPGVGFFDLAKQLGRDTSDILSCWVSELHRVHRVWSGS